MSTAATALTLREAQIEARCILDVLAPHCDRIEVAGSIRRGKPFVNDIEIVCIPKRETTPAPTDMFGEPIGPAKVVNTPAFAAAVRVLATEVVKGDPVSGRYVQFITANGVKVDLFMAVPENWGYIFLIRTGSADFSKMIATRWTQLGYKGVDGFLVRNGITCFFREEAELFDALGMTTPPPHEREMTVNGIANWIKR